MGFVKAGAHHAKPDWVKMSSWGLFAIPKEHAPTDLHFHDADEFWLCIGGKAKVRCGDEEHIMEPGDLLCAAMGDLHQTVEVLSDEPFRGVYLEQELRGKQRAGHLHPGVHEFPTAAETNSD